MIGEKVEKDEPDLSDLQVWEPQWTGTGLLTSRQGARQISTPICLY